MTLGPFPAADAITRLRAQVTSLRDVSGAADLRAAVENPAAAVPAAYVVIGEKARPPRGATGGELIQHVEALVQVVLMTRNYARAGSGAAAREEMDQLIAATREALINWSPGAAYQPLSMQASRDEIYRGGLLVTTQVFASEYRIRAQEQS